MSVIALAATFTCTIPGRSAHAQDDVRLPTIEIESQRSVTVIGSSDSLRAVIDAICEAGGVELKQYRAPDRPMTARYEEVPLRHVLERLLRQESFMLGFVAPTDGGEPEIAWLSVIGTEDGSKGSAGAGAGSAPKDHKHAFLPLALIAQENAAARNASAKLFARRLDNEQALRERFVSADLTELASALTGYKHARAFLQVVRTAVRNPQARAKVNSLLSRVR